MNLEEFFKSKENDPQVLQNEQLNEFRFHKVTEKLGVSVGMFYGEIDTGIFPHFTKHIYFIDADGYEVFEYQLSDVMDGVECRYGKPQLKRGRKIF